MFKKSIVTIIFLIFFGATHAQLRITEVGFDGTDEFVEITNLSNQIYSGNIDLVGVKSSGHVSIVVTGFDSQKSLIIGDKGGWNIYDAKVFLDQGLSLKDTGGWELSLIDQIGNIDTFTPSVELIQNLDKLSNTVQLVKDNDGNEILTGGSSSPGFFEWSIVENQFFSGKNEDVLFKDTGNNIGTGLLVLSGSATVTGDIYTGEFFSNGEDVFVPIENEQSASSITGNVLIQNVTNFSCSFSYVFSGGVLETTFTGSEATTGNSMGWYKKGTLYGSGISSIFSGFDGGEIELVVFNKDGSVLCNSSQFVGVTKKQQSINIEDKVINNYDEQETTTRNVPKEAKKITKNGTLLISEIHPRDSEYFGEYIEIVAQGAYSGDVEIQGLGRGESSKIVHVSLLDNQRVVLTDTPEKISGSIGVDFISLTDSGEFIALVGHSGQLMDNVVYTGSNPSSSMYFEQIRTGVREFNIFAVPTPGFTQDQVNHILGQDLQMNCSIVLQNKEVVYTNNSINLISSVDGENIQNNNSRFTCLWKGLLDQEESKKCNPSSITGWGDGIHQISVNIQHIDGRHCTTSFSLSLPSRSDELTCKQGYYQKLYHKRKDKYTQEFSSSGGAQTHDASEEFFSSLEFTGTHIHYSGPEILTVSGVIYLDAILPNPKGIDSGGEGVRLDVINSENIILDQLVLNNGKKRIGLGEGYLDRGFITLTGSLGLYNRPSCVRLESLGGTIFDILCYPQAKDSVWYSQEGEIAVFDGIYTGSHEPGNISGTSIIEESVCIQNPRQTMTFEMSPTTGEILSHPETAYTTGVLRLTAVLPNPEGTDGEFEGLRIHNRSQIRQDLGDVFISNGKTSKPLGTGYLSPGEQKEYISKRGLYNRPACVRLYTKNIVFSEFCYPSPLAGTRYTYQENIVNFAQTQRMGDIRLIENNISNERCVEYAGSNLVCKDNVYKNKYNKEQQKRKLDKEKYSLSLAQKSSKISLLDTQIDLHKEFIYDSFGLLRNDWSGLYYNTSLYKNFTAWQKLSRGLDNNVLQFSYGPVLLDQSNVTTMYKLQTDNIPLGEIQIQDVASSLVDETKKMFNVFHTKLAAGSAVDMYVLKD